MLAKWSQIGSDILTCYKYTHLESETHRAEMLKYLLLLKQDFQEG